MRYVVVSALTAVGIICAAALLFVRPEADPKDSRFTNRDRVMIALNFPDGRYLSDFRYSWCHKRTEGERFGVVIHILASGGLVDIGQRCWK